MPEPLLAVHGLVKTYATAGGRSTALGGVSMTIHHAEAVGLSGPSGSGKSTLARLLLGVETPDAGEIIIDGVAIGGRAANRRRLARLAQIIWQEPAEHLNPYMAVDRQVAEPLRAHGLADKARAAQRALELLTLVGLDRELIRRRPHELSGGQCQRVALARALALEPRLLICDEAVASLDLPSQLAMVGLLARLRHENGLAILFVGHDLALMARLCSRIYVMAGGVIVEDGPTGQVLRQPTHPAAKLLMASQLPLG